MPRYEFKEGTSNKFWEIELEEESFTTRYGRIGSDGQETTKDFDGPAEAKKEYKKLIDEKVKKGYVLVGGDGAPAVTKSNPALEAAIEASSKTPEAYLAYADWLQAQGDARGELIVVQAAIVSADTAKASELRKRESEIIEANKEAWLGAVAENESSVELNWRFGFLRSVRLAGEYDGDFDVADGLDHLLGSPAGRFLEGITIGSPGGDDGQFEYQPIVDVLTKRKPTSLRSLFIGDFEQDECEISWAHLGKAGKLWASLPRLESLKLHLGNMTLGTIDLPELREFTMETGGLDRAGCKSIATANWPKIERLHVWLGDENYNGDCTVKDLAPILDAKGLANVKDLGLMNAQFTDAIVEALVGSKILKQIEKLNLSMGTLTAAGAETLRKHKDAFKHLKELDLSDNCLEAADVAGLSAICADVKLDSQSPDRNDEDHRYPAVGE